jgi:hypothetical protein
MRGGTGFRCSFFLQVDPAVKKIFLDEMVQKNKRERLEKQRPKKNNEKAKRAKAPETRVQSADPIAKPTEYNLQDLSFLSRR